MNQFNEIYEKIYKENNKYLEELRKKETIKSLLIALIILGILATFFIIPFPLSIIVIAILILAFIMVISTYGKYNSKYKELVIRTLIKEYNENLEYHPNEKIDSNEYNNAEFEIYDIYESEDLIVGNIDNMDIKVAEVRTQEIEEEEDKDGRKHEEKNTLFHGMFAIINLQKSISGVIRIHANNGLIGDFFKGKKQLDMDSSEFEKYFDVYADNQIQAMQILTSDIMDAMVQFCKQYKTQYEITIKQDKLYIRFKCGELFEANMLKKSLDMDVLKKNYDMINFIFDVSKKLSNTINEKEL